MELNKIITILDDSGNAIDKYSTRPNINQYATNYLIEVAFKEKYNDVRNYSVVFTMGDAEFPPRILTPTGRYFTLDDGTESAEIFEYQLTQYETQKYQTNLDFSITVESPPPTENVEDIEYKPNIISLTDISLEMNKHRYSKLTPANLESDSSLNSVVNTLFGLNKKIDDVNTETKNEIKNDIDNEFDNIREEVADVISDNNIETENKINALRTELKDEDMYYFDILSNDIQESKNDLEGKIEECGTESKTYAKDYTDNKIEELVGAAPETLDTINEIAVALKGQDDVITALEAAIGEKPSLELIQELLNNKVSIQTSSGGVRVYAYYGNTQSSVAVDNGYCEKTTLPKYLDDTKGKDLSKMGSGKLLSADPVNPGHVANKNYVDNTLNGEIISVAGSSITLDMVPNKEYHLNNGEPISELIINSIIDSGANSGVNWTVLFTTGGTFTISIPDNIRWAVAVPIFDANKTYMISFIKFGEKYLGIWTVEG